MHIGLIMDGNGRWAKQRSLPRAAGHLEGLKACKRIVKAASEMGVEYLTLYVFSTENWKRPEQEVSYLMNLLAKKLPGEMDFYLENNVKIRVRGNISALPQTARDGINLTVEKTAGCTGLTVVLAINYGGQDEVARAVNRYIETVSNSSVKTDGNEYKPGAGQPCIKITPEDISANLDCPDIPAPDLIARSAGEMRLSNFMLWDSAYAEFLSIEKLWPDWDRADLEFCIDSLNRRVRKFGGVIV